MRRITCSAAVLWSAIGGLGGLGGVSIVAHAQDSVASVPVGNDALSSYDAAQQRVRYTVDLVQVNSGWNNPMLVGPIAKASRDLDPLFKTQILGSVAVSPSLATGLSFSPKSFSHWTSAGAGVHPSANSAPGSLNASAFASQFGLALTDFSLDPSAAVGATVGRVSGQFNRLYVDRVVAASSRPSPGAVDTSTISLGGIDALGNLALRADNFNTSTGTANRVLGDNLLRIDLNTRGASVNTLTSSGGSNTASDLGATTYVLNNGANPTNTPAVVNQPTVGPFVLGYDFANQFRTGSTTGNLSATTSHTSGIGLSGHRGNPTYSPITLAGGNAGTLASIAMPSAGSIANTLLVFGINFGAGGAPPSFAAGTNNAYTLPSPITSGSFNGNVSGQAAFLQYLSQTPWRGGNGQVAVGQNASNQLMLAATVTDPDVGEFIAVATITAPGSATWSVAAHPAKQVLNGVNGSVTGTIVSVDQSFSAPAMDKLGNVYFVAEWKPSLTPAEIGVFKAVNTGASGYKLELLLREGQTIVGANSTRPYTISSITLTDSDSVASGTMFAHSVIQQQDPAATTTNATRMRAFGGLIVSAVLSYDNGGPEAYDAVLYVGPTQGTDCPADFNNSGSVTVQDLFDFLAAWFAVSPSADFNNSGSVTVQDLFSFLAAWFANCPA